MPPRERHEECFVFQVRLSFTFTLQNLRFVICQVLLEYIEKRHLANIFHETLNHPFEDWPVLDKKPQQEMLRNECVKMGEIEMEPWEDLLGRRVEALKAEDELLGHGQERRIGQMLKAIDQVSEAEFLESVPESKDFHARERVEIKGEESGINDAIHVVEIFELFKRKLRKR
ncbi:hypothetical protein V6N13_113767 [Hibiscus sabdariffa]|uniref:Uncharacterized protein n=1 Tax=Hibiscus sabdariffa TaxID=183260 RepID=A0ABR2TZV2_9ROSI